MIQDGIANQDNYTIYNLFPNTTYNVCLVAHDGHGNTRSNWKHCAAVNTTTISATPNNAGECGSYMLLHVHNTYMLS